MSLQAYKTAATRAEAPRDMEYRLFGQVTRALMEAAKLDPSDLSGRADALDWNRRMWSAFATDCGAPESALPESLRASIISLAIWVGKHTSLAIRGQEDIQDLIDINRMIMQGLSGGGGAAEAA